jgi:hypothetical protein
MSPQRDPSSPLALTAYIDEGARIAAILLVWSLVGAFFTFVVSEVGGVGSLFETIGPGLGGVFAVVGLLNAILYVCYRSIDYWQG